MGAGAVSADNPGGAGTATLPVRARNGVADPGQSSEYSSRLATLAGFTVRHKALVIGGWIAVAVLLALVFPQLETVVRQQSVNLIPRDAASFQTVDRMSAAFGEQGSKTMLVVAMEDPDGFTGPVRDR